MIEPAKGPISSEFGVRRFINNQPRNRHGGMDIAAPEGTEVSAPLSGEIIIASNFFYKGNVIYINHGAGLVSSYSHLSKIEVKNGDKVKTGDLIGLVGKTGRVTGPHLHWEVYLMGTAINPEIFLATSI
jgi:murein DD-endopeptidase MepM/ murein hydrolase activator NlpD